MKKTILLTSCFYITVANAALTTVNLESSNYSCSGIKLTEDMSQSAIKKSCKNYSIKRSYKVFGDSEQEDNEQSTTSPANTKSSHTVVTRARFFTDQGNKMECIFEDGKLYKCKSGI
jgi:hypothetical protein